MNLRLTSILILALLALTGPGRGTAGEPESASQPATPSPLDRFTPEEREKLLAGQSIYRHVETKGPDGKLLGHGESFVIIEKPADYCFQIFSRYDQHQLYFPRKKKSEIVKTWDHRALVHKVFDFYVTTVEYTVLYTADPGQQRVDFQMDKSYPHDLEDTAGYFDFDPLDERRALFTYAATKVETGLKVPEFIQEYITSRDLPEVAANVKKRIESGGTWVKKD